MTTENKQSSFEKILAPLSKKNVDHWEDIHGLLCDLANSADPEHLKWKKDEGEKGNRGVGFITFDFGIDGVSIEIQKYALSLEKLFESQTKKISLHFISGDFHDKADAVLQHRWKRFKIEGINGWSKWEGGKWFSLLYYSDMPENSSSSNLMAQEIWKQTLRFSMLLGNYILKNNIDLLIPVNICSNPGNLAANLAVVVVTELLGINVISSNHDFYWEGGKADRMPEEEVGVRDHFFRNSGNIPFFRLFESVYPWNGKYWIQMNINQLQSHTLITKYHFPEAKVFEIGTCLSDKFFENYSIENVRSSRRRMAYILSDGNPVIQTVPIDIHMRKLENWMRDPKPIVCGFNLRSDLDISKDETIYCLQPTRVIARKRIDRNFKLLEALFQKGPLRDRFEKNRSSQLVLHITGPVPIEHQRDLEKVLQSYIRFCEKIPSDIADRVFIAFSVGTEKHPSLQKNGLEDLGIEEIYRLADIVLFPSETEGRGLPIVESCASGIPIVCSRYYPEEVFADVVGENLEEKYRIKYILFPEKDVFPEEFLSRVTEILLKDPKRNDFSMHNKNVVRFRYGYPMMINKFESFIKILENRDQDKGRQ